MGASLKGGKIWVVSRNESLRIAINRGLSFRKIRSMGVKMPYIHAPIVWKQSYGSPIVIFGGNDFKSI
jgi:hypothetical protein